MDGILRKRLKTWQKDFRAAHGREPRRADIVKEPEIAALYETWTALEAASGEGGSNKRQSKSHSKASEQKQRQSSRGNHSQSAPASMPPPPTTPSKSARQSEARERVPEPSTSAYVLKTPTKASRQTPSALPKTPTSSSASRRNPFATPKQSERGPNQHLTPQGGPATPLSALKLKSLPASETRPDNADRKLDDSFHYNTSPSSFRALVAQHSASQSPNRRSSVNENLGDVRMRQMLTPRSKARKRLRGEEVPPTPDSPPNHIGASQAHSQLSAGVSPSKKREGSQTDLLPLGESTLRPRKKRASQRGDSDRELSSFWATGFEKTGQSSSTKTDPVQQRGQGTSSRNLLRQAMPEGKQPAKSPASSQNASLNGATGRKFKSLFDDNEERAEGQRDAPAAISRENEYDDDPMSSEHDDEEESLVARSASADSVMGDSGGEGSIAAPRRDPAKLSQNGELILELSSDEDSDPSTGERVHQENGSLANRITASPTKRVFLRAYRGMGKMSLSGSREIPEGGDEDGFALGGGSIDGSQGGNTFAQDDVSSDSADEASTAPSLRSLKEHDSTSTLPAFLRLSTNPSMIHRSRLLHSRQAALSSLLSDQQEASWLSKQAEEDIESQQQRDANGSHPEKGQRGSSTTKPTWGGAKAANKRQQQRQGGETGNDFKLGRARRGMTDSSGLGTWISSDEEDDHAGKQKSKKGEAAKGDVPHRRPLIFKRFGRSGVDDDEEAVPRHVAPARESPDDGEDGIVSASLSHRKGRMPSDDDDDWASDVDEEQWGWNAELDDVDVI